MAEVGREEIERYMNEAGATGGGELDVQLQAWGIDFDDFVLFCDTWCNAAASRVDGLPMAQALSVALVAGYELGYRSALDVAAARAEDEINKAGESVLYVDDVIGGAEAA